MKEDHNERQSHLLNSVFINPDIGSDTKNQYFGCVEKIDEDGIFGWVINKLGTETPLAVSISLNNQTIGISYNTDFRPDISKILDSVIYCGFHFKWNKVKIYPKKEDKVKIDIKIDSTNFFLPISAKIPDSDIFHQWIKIDEKPNLSQTQKNYIIENFNSELESKDHIPDIKLIAFYLPQFHPVPENDEWWGNGFTEWTNVSQAKSLFRGHYQPHVPADLGYYDLRLSDTRKAQAELAKKYGIHGFCYYYYWFSGRKILERPLMEVLSSNEPDFPFCICWANENWSRRWDGSETDILLEQKHSEETDISFIHDVIPILKTSNYIRINGKPILIVYRLSLFPSPKKTADLWRKICRDNGLGEIFLCAVESFGYKDPYKDGFDATIQFPPHGINAQEINSVINDIPEDYNGKIYDYEEVVFNELNRPMPNYKQFRGLMCSWDNTARKKKSGNIFLNASPESYELWLKSLADYTRNNFNGDEKLIFVNAWNEWAEGTHLEPDKKFGHKYLEATKRALTDTSNWKLLVNYANNKSELTTSESKDIISLLNKQLQKLEHSLKYFSKLQTSFIQNLSQTTVFIPIGRSDISIHRSSIGGEARLEQIEVNNVSSGFENYIIRKGQPVFITGWTLLKNYNCNENTTSYLILEDLSDTKSSYCAAITKRCKRSDVVEFKTNYAVPESLFSGIQTYLDLQHVEIGEYKLGILNLTSPIHTITYFDGVLTIV